MRFKPPYLGNTHGPSDEVGKSQRAIIHGKLFFVDEDEAVVLHTVTVSSVTIGRTDRKKGDVVRTDLSRVLIEVDLSGFQTAAMPLGA